MMKTGIKRSKVASVCSTLLFHTSRFAFRCPTSALFEAPPHPPTHTPQVINAGGPGAANKKKRAFILQRGIAKGTLEPHVGLRYPLPSRLSDVSHAQSVLFHPPLSQSSRETKAASHVLQTVWSYKELRNTLTKDGWNKSHFQVGNETGNQNKILFSSAVQLFAVLLTHSALHQPTVTATPKSAKNGKSAYDDTTLPLMEKNQGLCWCFCMDVAAPTFLMAQMGWMRRR